MLESNPVTGLREGIAETVRVEMARRRMSQVALAQLTGLTQSYISRRMTGEVPFTTDDLVVIAQAFGMTVTSLMPQSVPA
jgi:transcriptional regulator with XRE-family HTH domain